MALDDLNYSIQLDENNAFLIFNRGIVYRFMKDYDEALKDFNKVIDLENRNYLAFVSRSRVYAILNENDKALADLEKAISLDNKGLWKDSIDHENNFDIENYENRLKELIYEEKYLAILKGMGNSSYSGSLDLHLHFDSSPQSSKVSPNLDVIKILEFNRSLDKSSKN